MAEDQEMTASEHEKQRQTNIEFVNGIMSFSKHGALAQVFVIEALKAYADQVVKDGRPTDVPGDVISREAWFEIGEEVLERIDAKYRKAPV